MLFGEQLDEGGLVDVAFVGDLGQFGAAADVAVLHEVCVEQGMVVALLRFVAELGTGFPRHLGGEGARRRVRPRCPRGCELRGRLQISRSLPGLGVCRELFERRNLGFSAKQKALPLDIDGVAHAALQFVDTHGAYMTPWSKKVAEYFEYNGCGHNRSPMLSPNQAAATPTTSVVPT